MRGMACFWSGLILCGCGSAELRSAGAGASASDSGCPAFMDADALAAALAEAAENDDEAAFLCQLTSARRERWASGAEAFPDQWAAWRRDILEAAPFLRHGPCRIDADTLTGRSKLVCGSEADERMPFVVGVELEDGGYRVSEN